MVGGFSRISHDVPPYTIGAGSPYKIGGLNIIGLKRHGFPLAVRKELARAFKTTYRSGLKLNEALEAIEKEGISNPHVAHWLSFCRTTKRGLIGFQNPLFDSPEEEAEEDLEEIEKLLEERL